MNHTEHAQIGSRVPRESLQHVDDFGNAAIADGVRVDTEAPLISLLAVIVEHLGVADEAAG